MIFEIASTVVSVAALGVCAWAVNKTLDETFKANERLYAESQNNAERADFWAREASQTKKDIMSVMDDNAERRHANLELNYKIAQMERKNDGK